MLLSLTQEKKNNIKQNKPEKTYLEERSMENSSQWSTAWSNPTELK